QLICRTNLLSISAGLQNRLFDSGRIPNNFNWCDSISCEIPAFRFICPGASDYQSNKCNYGLNKYLCNIPLEEVKEPSKTVLIFESEGGWNRIGDYTDMIKQPRHLKGYQFLFADFRVKIIEKEDLNKIKWKP
ncbi:MAG: hypothetical protein PHT33_09385, partial [bacterium]|nr:hypothetical protein [bacterium]